MYPEDQLYTKRHHWIRLSGGIGLVGITVHLQKQIGEILYIDLPRAGTKVERDQTMGIGGIGKRSLRYLRAGFGRGDLNQPRVSCRAWRSERQSAWRGLAGQDPVVGSAGNSGTSFSGGL